MAQQGRHLLLELLVITRCDQSSAVLRAATGVTISDHSKTAGDLEKSLCDCMEGLSLTD